MRFVVALLIPGFLVVGCGSDQVTPAADGGVASDGGRDGSLPDTTGDAAVADAGGAGGPDGAATRPDGSIPLAGPPEIEVDAGASVLRHHKNRNRDGVYVDPAFTRAGVTGDGGVTAAGLHRDTAFSAALPDPNDNVYAQPLFVDGMGGQDLLIVATEANNIYALDPATGAQVWTRNVGVPVPQSALPCGNIDPVGVTGTPVVDFASRTLFFDAEVLSAGSDGGVHTNHEIFALSVDTGAVKAGWPVDVRAALGPGAAFDPSFQGERGALAILGGVLYVPFGGRYGDCPTYHGRVVGISIADPTQIKAWSTVAKAGGVWAPGGVSSDGVDLYVATGNTQFATTWGGGDAVFRLGGNATGAAFAAPYDSFAPTNWLDLDNYDQDLGAAPILFDLPGSTPGHLAITFGKDGNAYLLDRAGLGGVGGALDSDASAKRYATLAGVTTNEIISAPVLYTTATATYVAFRGNGGRCTSGSGNLTALTIAAGSPPTLAPSWCAGGGAGSPIVTTSDGHADAVVWQLGAELDDRLHAYDGDTGAVIPFPASNVSIPSMRRYNAPIVAKGRLYVPADKAGIVAFGL